MASALPDPYAALGVAPSVSDGELRTAYRRLVQRHHPDHNDGSHESALRFAEIQEAYARVKLLRKQATAGEAPAVPSADGTARSTRGAGADPDLEARLAAMERELTAAREQREKLAREAAQATARRRRRTRGPADGDRPSDEELGYISTEDSFTRILDDFAGEVSTRFAEAQAEAQARARGQQPPQPPRSRSVSEWIDELGSRLTGERRKD